jgi:hypothetical protein
MELKQPALPLVVRFLFVFAVIAPTSCASTPRPIRLPDAQKQMVLPGEMNCRNHFDCVKIPVDGCGCSSGGFDGVANREYLSAIQKRLKQA